MDGDTEITFFPGDVVFLTEYGYAVIRYKGTYTIDPSGQIKMQLKKYRHEWPVMVLERDDVSLRLRPFRRGAGFIMGNRGGATTMGGQGHFWPFRPLTAEAEILIRKDWNRFPEE